MPGDMFPHLWMPEFRHDPAAAGKSFQDIYHIENPFEFEAGRYFQKWKPNSQLFAPCLRQPCRSKLSQPFFILLFDFIMGRHLVFSRLLQAGFHIVYEKQFVHEFVNGKTFRHGLDMLNDVFACEHDTVLFRPKSTDFNNRKIIFSNSYSPSKSPTQSNL